MRLSRVAARPAPPPLTLGKTSKLLSPSSSTPAPQLGKVVAQDQLLLPSNNEEILLNMNLGKFCAVGSDHVIL